MAKILRMGKKRKNFREHPYAIFSFGLLSFAPHKLRSWDSCSRGISCISCKVAYDVTYEGAHCSERTAPIQIGLFLDRHRNTISCENLNSGSHENYAKHETGWFEGSGGRLNLREVHDQFKNK